MQAVELAVWHHWECQILEPCLALEFRSHAEPLDFQKAPVIFRGLGKLPFAFDFCNF